jgi:hypothetical protein
MRPDDPIPPAAPPPIPDRTGGPARPIAGGIRARALAAGAAAVLA